MSEQIIVQTSAPWWETYLIPALQYFVVYIVSMFAAFVIMQCVKYYRREVQAPEMGDWQTRFYSAFVAGFVATFAANRIIGWELQIAIDHGINVMITFPLVMWLVWSYLKLRQREFYDVLRGRRRRPNDEPQPNGDDKTVSTTWRPW